MAFGADITESIGNVGGRTTAQGYNFADEVRKQYTGYERDKESGLDYAQARYYNSNHGRFTSVDPLMASASIRNPQTFNRYSYVLNSPYKFTDPLGLLSVTTGACGQFCANSGGYVDGSAFRGTDGSTPQLPPRPQTIPPLPPPATATEQNAQASVQQQTPVSTQTVSVEVPVIHPSCMSLRCASVDTETFTVTVNQLNNPDITGRDFTGNGVELRARVDLTYTFTDGNNQPINGMVQESVRALEGEQVYQETAVLPLNQGTVSDLVSTPPQPVPQNNAQTRTVINEFNKDFVTRQLNTITVQNNNGGIFQVTQERTLTNMNPNTPRQSMGNRGYSFTMQQPQIKIISPGWGRSSP